MRKSFTRLFSVFMLLNLFCISVLLAQPVFQGASSVPKQNANNVKPADVTSFVVTFNKAITLTASGGTFSVYSGTSQLLKTVTIPSASVQLGTDGKSLVINPGMTLTPGEYHLSLTAGAVKDVDGALNAAISEASDWHFVLGDYVAPKLLAGSNFTPKDDVTHLTPGTFTLVFDEPVAAGTGNIVLYRADGVVVDMVPAANADYSVANAVTVTFSPTDGYKDLTSYYVKVEGGAIVDDRSEVDVAGTPLSPVVKNKNKFAGINDNTTYNFSTKDVTAPVIGTKTVSAGGTSATLNVSLNEVGVVKYVVRLSSAGAPADYATINTATVDATNKAVGSINVTAANTTFAGSITGLETDKDYKVYLATEVTYSDASTPYTLNSGSVVGNVAFKTTDGAAPYITSNLTTGDLLRINTNKKTVGLKIKYNEEVVPGTGVVTIRRSSDNFGYLNIDASLLTVKKEGSDWFVTVPFATPLVSDVQYYVVMPQGVVKDKQNNPSVEVTQLTGFYITGSDYTVPEVNSVAFVPSTPATLGDPIKIKFSELLSINGTSNLVDATAITNDNLWIAFEKNNVPVAVSAITYNIVSSAGEITIQPSAALSANTAYSVRIRPNRFKDDNGNTIASELSYTLTTGDLASPAGKPTLAASPAPAGGKIQKTATFVLDFGKTPRKLDDSAMTDDYLKSLIAFKEGTNDVAFTVTYNATTFKATITPSASLLSAKVYTITVNADQLEDSQDVAFGDVAATNFTVVTYVAPTVTMKRSGNIYVGTEPAFAIEFSDNMYLNATALTDGQDVTSLITLKLNDANGVNVPFAAAYATATKSITLTAALTVGKTYYYGIGASLSDATGNKIAATSATFTYNDTQVVKATATSPAKAATGVVLTGTAPVSELQVSVTFDQIVSTVLGSTDAQRTAYLMKVGDNNIANAAATHIIVDADVVGSTLSFKFTGLSEAVFNPVPNQKWYVSIPATAIKSSVTASLLFSGFPLTTAAEPAMYFTAKDVTPPTATYTSGATLGLAADLTFTFNEKVVKGAGNIEIKEGATVVQSIDVTSSSVVLNSAGTGLTIKHSALPKYATAYTVNFAVDVFKDVAGNSLSAAGLGNFTTVSNTKPTVAELLPASGSDIVAAGANLVIKFSEPVNKVAGKIISLYKWDAALSIPAWVLVENILAENTAVSGELVTINPTADLLANTNYEVRIDAGAYNDIVLPASEILGSDAIPTSGWTFSTKNTLAPTATFTYTKRSDNKVASNSNIVITFNKPIEKANGTAITNTDIPSLFALKKTDVTPNLVLTFTGIISDDKMTVTLNGASFTPALASLSTYNISLVDLAMRGTTNNVALGSLNSTFIVSDYTKPVAVNPPTFSSVTSVKMTANLQSNEAGKIYYIFQAGDANTPVPSAATIMAGSSLTCAANTNVTKEFTGLSSQTSYVIFAVAEDALGNVSDVVKAVQSTTDVTGPVVMTKSSMFDKTAMTLSLTFNETVTTVTGNAVIIDKATMAKIGAVALSIDGTDNKKVNTAAWGAMPLTANEFYIEVEDVNIKDAAGNKFAGLYNTAWLVTTADQTAPTLSSVKPTAGTGIKLNEVFTVEFNENVKLADPMPVSAVIIEEGGNPYEVVANVSASGKIVTIDPIRNFKELTSYTLTIAPNSISDLAGNLYAAPITKTFTALDATPAVVTWSPDGTAAVAVATSLLTITFDQAISMANGTAVDQYDLDSLVTFTGTAATLPAHTKSITGNTISISLTGALASGTGYTYGIKAAFKGADGLAIPAQTKTFQTVQSAESITILPADNDNNVATRIPVAVNQTFTVSANLPFHTWSATNTLNNLPVTADYAKTAVKLYTVTAPVVAIDANVVVSADGRTISLTPVADLATSNTGVNYDLVILADKLQLGTGNVTAVNTANVTVQYVTVDIQKPVVDATVDTGGFTDGYSPAIGSIIGKSSALKLTFDENVAKGTGAIEIRRQDGVLVKSVDASAITTSSKVATIVSSMSDLPVNQLYYVVIPSGAIKDTKGNPFVGFSSITAWTFTLKDDVTPQATYTPNNVSGVAVNTDLKLTFDRAVVSNTSMAAPTSWIAVYKADGNAVELIKPSAYTSKVNYSADGLTATVDINSLEENTTYNVEIGEGAMKSTTDVFFAGVAKNMWSFSTEDNTAPKAIEFTPANAASIDLWENTLSVKFDKNIAKGSGKIYVRKAGGELVKEFDVTSTDVKVLNDVLSFTVTGLVKSTSYYVIIDNTAITNTSTTPEKFAGLLTPTAWTFSTKADDLAPTAEYAPKTIGLVPAAVKLTMTFSEPVLLGAGNLVIYNAADDKVVETVAIAQTMITDKVVTVVPTKLVEGTSYYVQVSSGAVKDLAGNNFAGVADKTTWAFSTGDFTAPVVESLSPNKITLTTANNHPTFVMTFKEDVLVGTGSLKVIKVGTTTPTLTIPVTAAMVSGKTVTVTYTYSATTGGLDKNTDYYVTVDAGTVKDKAGNAYVGIANNTDWTFKTGASFVTDVPVVNNSLKVYPNPFVDVVNFVTSFQVSKVVVTNIAGQKVKEVVNPTNNIQLGELRSGVYFISLYDMDNVPTTTKLLKK